MPMSTICSVASYVFTNYTSLNVLLNDLMAPDGAFYLKPLQKPKGDVWYTAQAVGHNTLASTVSRLCKDAGIEGFFTNHSLRTSAATRLFDAGVDEQVIMLRTGHRSTGGVRSYKRATESLKKQTSQVLDDASNVKKTKLAVSAEDCCSSEPQTTSMATTAAKENTNPTPLQDCIPQPFRGNIFHFQGSSNISLHFSVPQ